MRENSFMRTRIFSFDDTKLNQKELREKAFIVLKSLIEADLITNLQFMHEDINTAKVDEIIRHYGIPTFSEKELLN